MILRRILSACTALALCLGLLTGCWDRKEMDELAFVMASGIDLTEDGKLEVTLQIALPTGMPSPLSGGGKKAKSVLVVSGTGKEGYTVLGKMQEQLSRRVNFGHRRVIVIGEKLARKGINQVLDNLLRSPESRYNSYIATAYGASAKQILNAPYLLESIPAIGINKIMAGDFSLAVKIDKFLDALSSYGQMPVTPGIRIAKADGGDPTITLDKIAVYRENKLVGYLSGGRMQAFRLLTGRPDGMTLSMRVEPPKNEFEGFVGVQFLKVKPKIHTRIKNGKPEITLSFKGTGRVISNDTSLDMSKPATLMRLQKTLDAKLNKSIMSTVTLAQKKFKSDIFGFGREVHIQHPYVWKKIEKQWGTIYGEVPVHVETDVRIVRIGRTQAPGHLRKP
jgi:spore germination protein KC